MKYTLVIAILIASFFSCAPKSGPTPVATSKSATTTPEIKTEVNIKTESAAVAKGHETYTAKCGRCHELKTTTDYTAKEWVGWVDQMAPKAKLDESEKANVLAYVQFYAKSGN